MEKIVRKYIKPSIKVNNFISRNYLMGWEIGQGTTMEQLGHDPEPDLPGPSFSRKSKNVWENE